MSEKLVSCLGSDAPASTLLDKYATSVSVLFPNAFYFILSGAFLWDKVGLGGFSRLEFFRVSNTVSRTMPIFLNLRLLIFLTFLFHSLVFSPKLASCFQDRKCLELRFIKTVIAVFRFMFNVLPVFFPLFYVASYSWGFQCDHRRSLASHAGMGALLGTVGRSTSSTATCWSGFSSRDSGIPPPPLWG